jgi:hypothetical protein
MRRPMKVSARILVKQAVKYGHDVSIIDTSAAESYLLAQHPVFRCPPRWQVIVSFKITHRYARLCLNRIINQQIHPQK